MSLKLSVLLLNVDMLNVVVPVMGRRLGYINCLEHKFQTRI